MEVVVLLVPDNPVRFEPNKFWFADKRPAKKYDTSPNSHAY